MWSGVTCPFKVGWLTSEKPERQAASGSVQHADLSLPHPEGLMTGLEEADSFLSHMCPLGSLDMEIRCQ